MTVGDHGVGLSGAGQAGAGIRGMRERAGLIGANLEIRSNDDGGCTVVLSVRPDPARTGS
jgi:two-component system sensor histidine kinase UhpB